jgi:hypothetical protein
VLAWSNNGVVITDIEQVVPIVHQALGRQHELRFAQPRKPFTEPDMLATKSRLDKGIRAETVLNWPGKWSEWQDLNLRPLRPERSALPG